MSYQDIDPEKLAEAQQLAMQQGQAAMKQQAAQLTGPDQFYGQVVDGPNAAAAMSQQSGPVPAGVSEDFLNHKIAQQQAAQLYQAKLAEAQGAPLDEINKNLAARNLNSKLQTEGVVNDRVLKGQRELDAAYASGSAQLVQDTMGKYFPEMAQKYHKDAAELQASADKHVSETLAQAQASIAIKQAQQNLGTNLSKEEREAQAAQDKHANELLTSSKTRQELQSKLWSSAADSLNAVMTAGDPAKQAQAYDVLKKQGAFDGINAPDQFDPTWIHNAFLHSVGAIDNAALKKETYDKAPVGTVPQDPTFIQKTANNIGAIPDALRSIRGGVNAQAAPMAVPAPAPQQAPQPQAVLPQVAPQQEQPMPQTGPPQAVLPQVAPQPAQSPDKTAQIMEQVRQQQELAAPAEAQQAKQLNIGGNNHVPEIGAMKTSGGAHISEVTVRQFMNKTGLSREAAINFIKSTAGAK